MVGCVSDLPVVHPSEYIDPLRAKDSQQAIGVVEEQGVLIAIGDTTMEEWIRFER